ncbi:hypothetical protein [Virgibacillus sp. DJP39]|uniref:hypothetical protein n=1 Tax=Virgibacillus sp. DJP39 TaxID=3409790 RepID=UPI003BB76063
MSDDTNDEEYTDFVPMNEREKNHNKTTTDDLFQEIEDELKKEVEEIKKKNNEN